MPWDINYKELINGGWMETYISDKAFEPPVQPSGIGLVVHSISDVFDLVVDDRGHIDWPEVESLKLLFCLQL